MKRRAHLDPRPHIASADARDFRDRLLLRGWSQARANRFAQAYYRRHLTP